jgi:hypothetical protein
MDLNNIPAAPDEPPQVSFAETERFFTALLKNGGVGGRFVLRSFKEKQSDDARTVAGPWRGQPRDVVAAANRAAKNAAAEADDGFTTATALPGVLFRDGGGTGLKDVSAVIALPFDCDKRPTEALRTLVELMGGLPPTILVRSGGEAAGEPKLHAYYIFKQPITDSSDIARVCNAHKTVNTAIGGDPSATIVHPYRFPGSLWRKTSRRPVVIDQINLTTEITLADIDAAANNAKSGRPKSPANGHDASPPFCDPGTDRQSDDDLRASIINGEDLHNSLARLAWRMVARETDPRAARWDIEAELQKLMNRSARKESDPQTWKQRYDDIGRLVDDASEKQLKERAEIPADPLTVPMPAQEPFPLAGLPASFRTGVEALTDINEVEPAMAATVALSAASLAVAKLTPGIKLDGRLIPLAVWTACVAGSGERKTGLDRSATRGISEVETSDLAREYIQAKQKFDTQTDMRKQLTRSYTSKAAKTAGAAAAFKNATAEIATLPPLVAPRRPHIVTPDGTIEGLRNLLADGHGLAGLFASDGATFVAGHSLTDRDRRMGAAAFLSQLWDGISITVTRASGDIVLSDPRVAVSLGLQPRIAKQFFGDPDLRDQGLLSRVLVCWPKPRAGTRSLAKPHLRAVAGVEDFNKTTAARLREALDVGVGAFGLGPRQQALTVTPEAEMALREFAIKTERAQAEGGPFETVRGWASKAAEQALRIAGVLTLFENETATEMEADIMLAAVALAEWYAHEWLRISEHAQVQTSPSNERAERVLKCLQRKYGKEGDTFCARDIYKAKDAGIGTRAGADESLSILERFGYIEPVGEPKSRSAGRKPLCRYRLARPPAANGA